MPLNEKAKQCEAKTRAGEPCKNPALSGSNVCIKHGGAAPQVRAKAAERLIKEELFSELEGKTSILGDPIYSDPVTILYDLIALSAGHVAWYRDQIQALVSDAIVWNETAVSQSGGGRLSVSQTASVNKWVDLYNAERRFLADLSARAIAAGLAEREIKLEEERGRMLAETIRLILSDLELSPDQSERALEIVPMKLRELVQG